MFVCGSNQAKTTKPIQMKLCKKLSYIPGSNIGLFSVSISLSISRWIKVKPFRDDGTVRTIKKML